MARSWPLSELSIKSAKLTEAFVAQATLRLTITWFWSQIIMSLSSSRATAMRQELAHY